MKNLELDLSFTEMKPNLWDTYEMIILAFGPTATEAEFEKLMGPAGFGDCNLDALYRDFKWYIMCARPERIRRRKD